MDQSTGRANRIALGLLLASIALFFWKLLFSNLILARGDTFIYFYPYWEAAARSLRAGRLALWNPDLFMGAPFLANSQVGLLYPLNWPFWLLLDTPSAVSYSIGFHLILAAVFTNAFARDGLGLRPVAAWLAGLLFALGGYLGAQVEHVNQLQGLAWLPVVFYLLALPPSRRRLVRLRPVLLGLVFGLQFLAGHTQAVFITVMGALIYAGWLSWRQVVSRRSETGGIQLLGRLPLAHLLLGGGLALLLAAAQILPTWELTHVSIRSGTGLPLREAVSFSLHPLLVGRSLLPALGQTIFSEYTAFLPLSALLLAVVGAWLGRRRPPIVALALVAGIGLFFALGAANPFYVLLARYVPGFGLFRAPARWLVLHAFGAAGLAGVGLDAILEERPEWLRARKGLLLSWLSGITLLALWSVAAFWLQRRFPPPAESPIELPAWGTLALWVVEAGLALWFAAGRRGGRWLLAPLAGVVLFLSSRALPYNHPTAPEAYASLRPAPAFLQAAALDNETQPPARYLSMSNIFFDPGDQGELLSIYEDQLPADAIYDLVVAIKQKEIVAPNLSLVFGFPAVDGYDGGVLPLQSFVDLERLLLPPESVTMDGRLREVLPAMPDGRWLNLFNTRYVVTDKVGDLWADGVFYDLQHQAGLDPGGAAVEVAYVPAFEATEIGVVGAFPAGDPAWEIHLSFADGRTETLSQDANGESALLSTSDAQGAPLSVARLALSQPAVPTHISIAALGDSSITVHGMSLIDSRDDSFQSLVVSSSGRYRLVHSSDVKIYENLDVLPRAFLVNQATYAADSEDALARMLEADFDPAAEVVLLGIGESESLPAGEGTVEILEYEPELVRLRVESEHPTWLVLSDLFYPGWEATVDDEPAVIQQADVAFRALHVPAGSHEVVFSYRPNSVRAGAIVSLATLAVSLALLGIGLLTERR